MVGDVVGGYVVKEVLASGRSGLLFLAVHTETGHRAVVQRRLGEDDLRQFAREAAQILGLEGEPHVERRRSRAGVGVLLAVVDADAPGAGYTDYTNTEQLPDLTPRPAPPKRRYLLGLSLLVVVGAVIGGLAMSAGRQHDAEPLLAPTPWPRVAALPLVERPAEAGPPPDSGALAVAEAAPTVTAPVSKAQPAAVPLSAKSAPTGAPGPSYCEGNGDSEQWKAHARADLGELMQRAAPHDELAAWADAEERGIDKDIEAATTGSGCKAIEKRIGVFLHRVVAQERLLMSRVPPSSVQTSKPGTVKQPQDIVKAPQACTIDDRFRDYARRTRADLRAMGKSDAPEFMRVDAHLAVALIERDCRGANAALDEMRRLAGAPVEEPDACEPDERWKSSSRLSLSELRGRAAGNSKKYDLFEAREAQLSRDIASARTNSQCAGVEASLKKLLQELNE